MSNLRTCYTCWVEISEGNFADHEQWHETLIALIKGERQKDHETVSLLTEGDKK